MLPDRIESIAPNMPPDIRRWFLERDYAKPGYEHQDWDASLAEWDFGPLLSEYIKDPFNPIEKRFEAFSALILLQTLDPEKSEAHKKLDQEIKKIVLAIPDFARKVSAEWLGLPEARVVARILGEETPQDFP
jgi:hypothetical protein